jgi:hypothetical protein
MARFERYDEQARKIEEKKILNYAAAQERNQKIREKRSKVVLDNRQIKQSVQQVGEIIDNAKIVNELTYMNRRKAVWEEVNKSKLKLAKNQNSRSQNLEIIVEK